MEGYTVSEAEKVLKELNLNMECSEVLQNAENGVISEQIPISGVEIFEGSSVIVK